MMHAIGETLVYPQLKAPITLSTVPSKPVATTFCAQWLYFCDSRWVPLDTKNQHKLENTLQLDSVFIDIEDSHFPNVSRVRVFPGSDYLSYLGTRYRISRILLPLQ